MKFERAQEIYSDYQEGSVSPAMKLALEQHFEAEPAAKQDFDEFSRVLGLLSDYTPGEVEVPHAFRAKIMERVASEGVRQSAPQRGGIAGALRNLFSMPRRREAAAVLAFVMVVAAAVVLKPGSVGPNQPKTSGPLIPGVPIADTPTVIQGMGTRIVGDTAYHDLNVHLPDGIPRAVVNVYASSTDQILDPAVRDRDATPVLKNQELTNDESMTVPMALARPAPAGSTLVVLVEWSTPGSTVTTGSQVVFTPFNPSDGVTPSTAPPSNGNFFDSLQTIASAYHTTVIVDSTLAPTTEVQAWSPGEDVGSALQTVANSAGFNVKSVDGVPNTFLVYRPAQR